MHVHFKTKMHYGPKIKMHRRRHKNGHGKCNLELHIAVHSIPHSKNVIKI